MRRHSEKQVEVRGKVIGGEKPLVCLPLVGVTRRQILDEAKRLVDVGPDLLEWRVDACEFVESTEACISLLEELRLCIGDIPLIFTCRIESEGGMKSLSRDVRLDLFLTVIAGGNVDIVDVELCNDHEMRIAVQRSAAVKGVRVILSYHNFEQTPSEQNIISKLVEAQEAGADIAKLAVMPKDYGDVLTLMNATYKARCEHLKIPIVTMSMGGTGAVSRVVGGLFGSDITFAIGVQSSAPGQIPIAELRGAMAACYP